MTRPPNAVKTVLQDLRSATKVDCDTLDSEVAKLYGPFEDCTSNQAIAYTELKTGRHEALLQQSAKFARELHGRYPDQKIEMLAGEIATILLSLRMVPHLAGFNHVQVNTFDSESTNLIVAGGLRIKNLCQTIDPSYDATRLCIKIPSTWAGLQACRILERDHGIRTLATTLFGYVQGIVAGEAGCRYIAPYIHGLPDVMGSGPPDSAGEVRRMMVVAASTQEYFERQGLETQVLPAALMTAQECVALRGVHHITLSPARLQELDALQVPVVDASSASFIPKARDMERKPDLDDIREEAKLLIEDEEMFRLAVLENDGGVPLTSMKSAIRIFNEMQLSLEQLMTSYCGEASP